MKKDMLDILVAKAIPTSKEDGDLSDDSDLDDDALGRETIAASIIKAVKSGNASMLADALNSFLELGPASVEDDD